TGLLDHRDRTIERDPTQHLRMREVPAPAAHFPDALVGLAPARLEDIEQEAAQRPRVRAREGAGPCRLPQDVEQLAVYVELALGVGAVAGAYRSRALESGQPLEL